jgi:hypothetical protein
VREVCSWRAPTVPACPGCYLPWDETTCGTVFRTAEAAAGTASTHGRPLGRCVCLRDLVGCSKASIGHHIHTHYHKENDGQLLAAVCTLHARLPLSKQVGSKATTLRMPRTLRDTHRFFLPLLAPPAHLSSPTGRPQSSSRPLDHVQPTGPCRRPQSNPARRLGPNSALSGSAALHDLRSVAGHGSGCAAPVRGTSGGERPGGERSDRLPTPRISLRGPPSEAGWT